MALMQLLSICYQKAFESAANPHKHWFLRYYMIIHNYIFHHFRKHLPAFPQSNTPKFHSRNHFFFSFFRYYNQGFRDHFNLLLRRIFHINTRLFDTFFCFFTKQKDPAFFNARSHFLFLILFSK